MSLDPEADDLAMFPLDVDDAPQLFIPDGREMVRIHIPGDAVGKQRQRANFTGAGGRLYTPAKTVNYETLVAMCAQEAMAGREPIQTPVDMIIDITVKIPASWSKRKQADALAQKIYPGTKPDSDNVEKALCDGLNGVAWRDDVLVVTVAKRKRYGRTPGVDLVILPAGTLPWVPVLLTTTEIPG